MQAPVDYRGACRRRSGEDPALNKKEKGCAFGGTFKALLSGPQGALWALGDVPEVSSHDPCAIAASPLIAAAGDRCVADPDAPRPEIP